VGAEELAVWLQTFSYPAVLALLLACGVGAPLSEELILVSAGLVVAHGHGVLWAMIATAWVGTVLGDLTLYSIGRKLGPRALEQKKLKKLLTPERVAWIEGHFRKYGALTIFVVRFTPGLRAPTFLVAGLSRVQPRKFLLADALGAMITAPLLTWLGWRFGLQVLAEIKSAGQWVLLGVAALIVVLMVRRMIKRHKRQERGESEMAARMLERDLREGTR